MKKASVVVVLSVLVLVLSLHFLLSFGLCRKSTGTDFRGGCYMPFHYNKCNGGELTCNDLNCNPDSIFCPEAFTRLRLIDGRFSSVDVIAETGTDDYGVELVTCYNVYQCSIRCKLDRNGSSRCTNDLDDNQQENIRPAFPTPNYKYKGNPCEETADSER